MSAAAAGRRSYAFIPDAGMVGTAFVHALANAQATAATGVELVLSPAQGCVLGPAPGHRLADGVVALGAAQHGQARPLGWSSSARLVTG
jgi:hypothetical protein